MDAFASENRVYRFGDFEVEVGRRVLRAMPGGTPVSLTPRAFDLLLEFLRRPQVLIEKEELICALWPDTVVEENNLEHTISVLRQALGDRRGEHQYIKTIHRRGYQFTVPVALLTQGPAASHNVGISTRARPRKFVGLSLIITILAVFSGWQLWRHERLADNRMVPASDRIAAVLWFDAPQSGEGQLLAESITHLLEDRLASVKALGVISPDSIVAIHKHRVGGREASRKLGARYLLSGKVSRDGDLLQLEARLVDGASGTLLWTKAFRAPIAQLTAIREDIVQSVVNSIHVDSAVHHEAEKIPVDLDVYELYRKGERLIGASATISDIQKASAIFERTTTLDPNFARGYLGIAQAVLYQNSINATLSKKERDANLAQASRAIDRALELDPGLGRAWVQRAQVTIDVDEADRFFRRGIELSPNDSVNAMFYSSFLLAHGRMGEALSVVHRARRLDPLSALLAVLESDALMDSHSDVEGSERLLNEAHSLDPDFPVTTGLANLRWRWKGQFADAVRMLERETKAGIPSHAIPAMIYLDMDDLQAAISIWNEWDVPPPPFIMIAQYQGRSSEAASLARALLATKRVSMFAHAAEAIRDDAIARHDYAPGIALLEPIYVSQAWSAGSEADYYVFAAAYVHMLILSGDEARGRQLAKQLLAKIDADEIGRPAHWYSRDRAALLMLLGDKDHALRELAASQALNHWTRWWYTESKDPLYLPLHDDARFQNLVGAARQHRSEQRALLEAMRKRGEVPLR